MVFQGSHIPCMQSNELIFRVVLKKRITTYCIAARKDTVTLRLKARIAEPEYVDVHC
jgi:hypothetical protein